jgi:hypothetical protein
VVIALVVTPDGMPLAFEMLLGNTGRGRADRLPCPSSSSQ